VAVAKKGAPSRVGLRLYQRGPVPRGPNPSRLTGGPLAGGEPMTTQLLSSEQVCDYLGLPASAIDRLREQGRLRWSRGPYSQGFDPRDVQEVLRGMRASDDRGNPRPRRFL
jgi:hypothetical protein